MNFRFPLIFPLLMLANPLFAQEKEKAPDWTLKPTSSLQKLTASAPGKLRDFKATPVQIQAARGEWESFQFVVTAGKTPIESLKISATGLSTIFAETIAPTNFHFFRENFVEVKKPSGNRDLRRQFWPDALVPVDLASQKIAAGESAVYWVSVQIPRDAKPDDYFGELDISANNQARRLALTFQVGKQILPEKPTFRATAAVYYDVLRDWYLKDGKTFSDADWEIQKRRFYDFLLDYRINAYDLPVDWDSPFAESYLRDSRVLSVRVPALDSSDFGIALSKFKQTETLDKAFYYRIDEPDPTRAREIKTTTEKLRKLGVKHLVTVAPKDSLKDAVDIWCANVGDFFGAGHLNWKNLENERKRGHETWLYTMVEPKFPLPTWLLDDDASSIRVFGDLWQRENIGGFVYSMAHGWGPQPLQNLQSFAGTNGDGTLLYPAEIVGGVGPMPSIRLMLLRDAIEDFELKRRFSDEADKFFPRAPTDKRIAANGNATFPQNRWSDAPLPLSRVGWKTQNDVLTADFFAPTPREGDFVAVELAPRDGSEKWRFVQTFKGRKIVERRTSEGVFELPDFDFTSKITRQSDSYRVHIEIALDSLPFEGKNWRFDAIRSTKTGLGTRFLQRLAFWGADASQMPILTAN